MRSEGLAARVPERVPRHVARDDEAVLFDRARERGRRGPQGNLLLGGAEGADGPGRPQRANALAKRGDRADRAGTLVLDEGRDLAKDDVEGLGPRDLLENHSAIPLEKVAPRQSVLDEPAVLSLALEEDV